MLFESRKAALIMLKNFKIGLPILALALAVAASAFTGTPHREATSPLWQYEPVNANGPSDPLNYVKLEDAQEVFVCEGNDIVCQIEANESMGKPSIPPGDDPSVQVAKYHTSFRED